MSTRPKKINFAPNKQGSTTLQKQDRKEYNLPEPQNSIGKKPVFNLAKKKIMVEEKTEPKVQNGSITIQKKQEQTSQSNKIIMKPFGKKLLSKQPKQTVQIIAPPQVQQKAGQQTKRTFNQMKTPFSLRKSIQSKQKIIFRDQQDDEKIPQKPKIQDNDQKQQFLRPNMRPKKPNIPKKSIITGQQNFQDKIYTSVVNQYEISKQFPSISNNNYQINIADLQQRQINFDEDNKHVSEGKIQKQKQRVANLKKLLNLEIDSYESTFSLGSITQYQLYINKIKSGFINNSLDQAFDDTTDAFCQTLSLDYQDFGQQCPDDRNKTFLNQKAKQQYQSISFYNFIAKAGAVIQELLRPSKIFVMPPIFLLSLNPIFTWFSYCPYPTFLYKTNQFSVIAIGQKLYVARGDINTVLGIGKFLLGGTKQGGIFLWAGKSQKGSFYDSVYSILNNSDFELPSFSTQTIQKQSYFKNFSQIVKFIEKSPTQFYSLQEFGKIILWRITTEQNKYGEVKYSLKPLTYISLTTLYADFNLLCFDMQKDQDGKLYISSNKGIIRGDASRGTPQLYSNDVRCQKIYVTKKGNLMYCLNNDNSLSIFDRNVSSCLLRIQINTKAKAKDIIIPKIQVQGRQLEILSQFYVIDSRGYAYRYNLLQSKSEPRQIVNNSDSEDKKFLYSSVSIQDNQLQFLYVTRQLKTKLVNQKNGISLEVNTKNFKRIVDQNKKLRQLLEQGITI